MNFKNMVAGLAVIACGVFLTACPSLWKHAQIIKLSDETGKVIGGIGGFKVHYPVNNTDADDKNTYTDDHYSIVITNANTGPLSKDSTTPIISTEDLVKVSAIGVMSNTTGKSVTDDTATGKYFCDQSIDPKSPGFGCRILSTKLGDTKIVYIKLQLTDGTFWKSDDLDLNDSTESTELGTETKDFIVSIFTGKQLTLTLKTCPADAYGKIVETTIDKECPAGAKVITNPDPDTNKDCAPPNYLDTNGTCISILQPQKTCDADSVTLLDGTCGTGCGTFQIQKFGKCQCQSGYVKDSKGTGCIVDPTLNASLPAPSSGGGSCSLIRMN